MNNQASGIAKLLASSENEMSNRKPKRKYTKRKKPKEEDIQSAEKGALQPEKLPYPSPDGSYVPIANRPEEVVLEQLGANNIPDGIPKCDYDAMRRFLEVYSKIGNASRSCEIVGISRATYTQWVKKEPGFQQLFEEAKEEAGNWLEYEAWRRAVEGVDKPIYYKGEKVDTVKEYSDSLLMFLLKGTKPEKYRDRVEHTVKGEVKFTPKAEQFAKITMALNKFRERVERQDLSDSEVRAITMAVEPENDGDEHSGNGHAGNGHGAVELLDPDGE